MLTIIGAIVGLLGSLAPELLKFFNNKEDHKFQKEMAALQMEELKIRGEIDLTKINAQADIESEKALYEHSKLPRTGWKYIDGLISFYTGTVRPTITYLFMGTYILVKYGVYMSYTQSGYTWQQAVAMVWSGEDFAIFATIMGFWFGGRFLKYSLGRITPSGK